MKDGKKRSKNGVGRNGRGHFHKKDGKEDEQK